MSVWLRTGAACAGAASRPAARTVRSARPSMTPVQGSGRPRRAEREVEFCRAAVVGPAHSVALGVRAQKRGRGMKQAFAGALLAAVVFTAAGFAYSTTRPEAVT